MIAWARRVFDFAARCFLCRQWTRAGVREEGEPYRPCCIDCWERMR
jgi:hypothetical protein